MSDWDTEEGVTCVVCPDCAFTFDAHHTDTDDYGYSCPACNETNLRFELDALKESRSGWVSRDRLYQVGWWVEDAHRHINASRTTTGVFGEFRFTEEDPICPELATPVYRVDGFSHYDDTYQPKHLRWGN